MPFSKLFLSKRETGTLSIGGGALKTTRVKAQILHLKKVEPEGLDCSQAAFAD